MRNNFKIFCPRKQREITAQHLFYNLKVGELRHYSKIVKMHGEYCYVSGSKTIKEGKTDFCIIVSFNKPEQALEYYAKRWQIETLFRGLKTSGFNLEDTHLTHLDRLEKLILLVMIAFIWCYKIGDFIDRELKPIKVKKHGRRAVSIFKYGLEYLSKCLLRV
ncbi:transposase [Aquimarina sp. ERC-38]|uniref:transposase n=1 Tax=Aquimarina sp. ERC-38 TaxID=2949996 RepID=UPI0022476AB6|nr:transposase [Aquimarina sp. ERC-38]UZO82658.1 transposase [Aquimarina sp. ERC-38]